MRGVTYTLVPIHLYTLQQHRTCVVTGARVVLSSVRHQSLFLKASRFQLF